VITLRPESLALVALLTALGCGGDAEPPLDEPPGSWSFATGADGAEAGFFEIPAHQITSVTFTGKVGATRLWYSFQPATSDPLERPLVVLYNGGPGGATSTILMSYGVGAVELAPGDTGVVATPNPDAWTRFANLLFVDARQTGFSYGVGAPSDDAWDPYLDAGDVTRLVAEFLERHDELGDNPVVFAGESYGSVRTNLAINAWTRPERLIDGVSFYQDRALASALQRQARSIGLDDDASAAERGERLRHLHLQGTFAMATMGTNNPDYLYEIAPERCARWEGSPRVSAGCRADNPSCSLSLCLEGAEADEFDIREPSGSLFLRAAEAETALRDGELDTLLGVDASEIAWLLPDARTEAFRMTPLADPVADGLVDRFGALGPDDRYFIGNAPLLLHYPDGADFVFRPGADLHVFAAVLENLAVSPAMITDAVYDTIVLGAIAPDVLATAGAVTVLDADDPRARRIRFTFADSADSVEIPWPEYQAGHAVSIGDPGALADDVERWLAATAR
jgi:hypothetical protein